MRPPPRPGSGFAHGLAVGVVVALVALVVLVTAGAATWWFRPFAVVADEGASVDVDPVAVVAYLDGPEPRESVVRTPLGETTVGVITTDRLPAGTVVGEDFRTADDRYAPRGSTLLVVTWSSFASLGSGPLGPVAVPDDGGDGTTARPAELRRVSSTVVVRDAATGEALAPAAEMIGPGDEESGGTAVVVADVDDVVVGLEFDGEEQTLDPATGEVDAGLAAPLYEPDPSGSDGVDEVPCDVTSSPPVRPSDEVGCRVDVIERGPWSAHGGWVDEPGQGWVSVELSTFLPDDVVPATEPVVTVEGGEPALLEPAPEPEDSLDPTGPSYSRVTWLQEPDETSELRLEVPLSVGAGLRDAELAVVSDVPSGIS